MNVVPLKPKPYVLIDSGRVTASDDTDMPVGMWIWMVDYVDDEGFTVHDTMCATHDDALDCAEDWAALYGCRIIDRSTPEPKEGGA